MRLIILLRTNKINEKYYTVVINTKKKNKKDKKKKTTRDTQTPSLMRNKYT